MLHVESREGKKRREREKGKTQTRRTAPDTKENDESLFDKAILLPALYAKALNIKKETIGCDCSSSCRLPQKCGLSAEESERTTPRAGFQFRKV